MWAANLCQLSNASSGRGFYELAFLFVNLNLIVKSEPGFMFVASGGEISSNGAFYLPFGFKIQKVAAILILGDRYPLLFLSVFYIFSTYIFLSLLCIWTNAVGNSSNIKTNLPN